MQYPLVDISEVESTKQRILLAAVRMFAERGYAAVSIRDIAAVVNIKPPSIYSHFESKEALFDAIVEMIEKVYMDFYSRLGETVAEAQSYEEVLDCLFAELIEVYHMFVYYGVSLIATEQFCNERARRAFQEVYMKQGIDYSTRLFEGCIEKGWVKPFDARALATLFMNSIFAGSLVRTHEDLGHEAVYEAQAMFRSLRQLMLDAVQVIE